MERRKPGAWVGLAGRIGAGKSTLARSLCQGLPATYVGIGDYVRGEATRLERSLDRAGLQELGSVLIRNAGGDAAFLRRVVEVTIPTFAETGSIVVVDGIRHPEMVTALRVFAASAASAVAWVEVDEATRLARLSGRGFSPEEIASVDEHGSERHGETLRAAADVVVPGDDCSLAEARIVAALADRGGAG